MKKFVLDAQNATQFAKVLSQKDWPHSPTIEVKHGTHPSTGKAHVMIMSLHPLERIEQEIKKFMFLYGRIIPPLQLIPIE